MVTPEEQCHAATGVCPIQQPGSYFCSRPVLETLASCFESTVPGVRCGGSQVSGPVDVEDLAGVFSTAGQPSVRECTQKPRPYKVNGYPRRPPGPSPTYVEEAALAYCTDTRWMACPATSYCPLYESQRPIDSWHVLPCAQELLHGYFPKLLTKLEIQPEVDELLLTALDGFVLVLDNNGDMAYLSPNVKDYLGIAQMDLMGQSVFDYSHPCDHDEIRESLSLKTSEAVEHHNPCNIFLRLKCTLTSKGRKVNLKSASYKVIHCRGRLIVHPSTKAITNTSKSDDNSNNENSNGADESDSSEESHEKEPGASLVVVASPVPHPGNIEIPMGKSTFLSQHNLSMKFTYADDKLAEFLGWESNDLMGQSVFEFHHALDNVSLDKSFKSLFSKGQCETMAYRFLNKQGGYAWVVTQATLIHCSRLQKPLSVVCVNYLLSGVEHEDEVYSVRQVVARDSRLHLLNELKEEAKEEEPVEVPEDKAPKPLVPLQPKKTPVSCIASLLQRAPTVHQLSSPSPLTLKSETDSNKENDNNNRTASAKVKVPFCEPEAIRRTPAGPVPPSFSSPDPVVYQPPFSRPVPQTATASIFAPRTEDMNTGFLMFCEDQPGLTMLKDEPDDLTHLAPTPGDVCVPLDPPFLTDMFDEFILSSNYCPLLSPELSNEPPDHPATACNSHDRGSTASNNSCTGSCNGEAVDPLKAILTDDGLKAEDSNSSDGDPFIYRDSSSRCSLGTDLHSPTSSKSPESSGGGDSLGSPYGNRDAKSLNSYVKGETHVSDDDGLLTMNFNDMMYDEELEMRAPYIPMCDQDETLQMLMFDDMVMWGASTTQKKPKLLSEAAEENSSLAQLLTNESSLKQTKVHENLVVNPVQVLGQVSVQCTPTAQDITAERENTNKRVHSYSSKSGVGNKRVKHADLPNVTSCNLNSGKATRSNLSSLERMLSDPVQSSQLLQQLVSQQVPKNRNWQDSQQISVGEPRNRLHTDDNNRGNGTSRSNNFSEESHVRRLDDKGGGNDSCGIGGGDATCSSSTSQRLVDSNPRQVDAKGGGVNVLRRGPLVSDGVGKSPQQQSNSVLMNLLVSGCDVEMNNNNSGNNNLQSAQQPSPQLFVPRMLVLPPDKLSLSPLRISADEQRAGYPRCGWFDDSATGNPSSLRDESSPGPMRDKLEMPPPLVRPSALHQPPPISPPQSSPASCFDMFNYDDFVNATTMLSDEAVLLDSLI
ncbi:protein similar-like [Copidosoma floridanum]|uniref:protein similar-like n=1 Tax=Copidosoma floridanum TaxID=29053 RepID=UPI0006C9D46F|nr:protein similar-like [Copidosoma floridanum]